MWMCGLGGNEDECGYLVVWKRMNRREDGHGNVLVTGYVDEETVVV